MIKKTETDAPVEQKTLVSERNFIDEREKDDIFAQEKTSFMENIYKYLNRKEFPVRFVLSRYMRKTEERTWRPES